MAPRDSNNNNNNDEITTSSTTTSTAAVMPVLTAPSTPHHHEMKEPTVMDPPTDSSTDSSSTASSNLEPVLQLKYRRRALGLPTTAIIPAVRNHPVVQEMQRLVRVFEHEFLPSLEAMYLEALEQDWVDDDNGGWYKGVRRITGGRYEIKVLGEYFTSLPGFEALPRVMVDYAQAQAMRDEKVQAMMQNNSHFTFADWSIIISQQCDAQTIHTDVPVNNVQFGLMMNSSSSSSHKHTPGTQVVLREDFGPHSVEELVSGIWSEAPTSVRDCLLEQPHVYQWCNKILNVFGPMLQRRDELEANMAGAEVLKQTDGGLDCGDLICTSGGVPHAGPACDHFRMVMFGAASPTPQGLYDVDDQFFAHSALLYVLQAAWDYLDSEGRAFLLRRLAEIAMDYDRSIADKHESTSALLTDFMNVILDVREEGETVMDSVVEHFMRLHGHKSQADLFDFYPPGLQALQQQQQLVMEQQQQAS